MACGIYKIINNKNGKFYIGSTNDTDIRFSRHKCDLRNGKHVNYHLQNSWNLYGENNFSFVVDRECEVESLLTEEQVDLNKFFGTKMCYNLSPSSGSPNIGIPRSEETKRKISIGNIGKIVSDVTKARMRVSHVGITHSEKTKEKMKGRISSIENIRKAQVANVGRTYSEEHKNNISIGKKIACRKFTDDEIDKIKRGVNRAFLEGRHKKNKIPKNETENIKELYLSGTMNKRQLSIKYGVTACSMAKFIKKNIT